MKYVSRKVKEKNSKTLHLKIELILDTCFLTTEIYTGNEAFNFS